MRKALNIPLEEFLRPFFGPGERICLRIFDDRKTGTFKGAKLETSLSGLPGLMDTLKKHNEKNRGIYFVVNFGGHEDSEITRINAQFMECDELPLDEQLKQIEAFPLEPSLIVKTRKIPAYLLAYQGRGTWRPSVGYKSASWLSFMETDPASMKAGCFACRASTIARRSRSWWNVFISTRSFAIRRPSWNNTCRRFPRNPLRLPGQRPMGRSRAFLWS